MSKVYRKIEKQTIRAETPNDVVEIAVITFLAIPANWRWWLAAASGWTGILARLAVEVLKTVGTADETARNGFLIVAILIVMITRFCLRIQSEKLVLWVIHSRTETEARSPKYFSWYSIVNTMKEQAEIEFQTLKDKRHETLSKSKDLRACTTWTTSKLANSSFKD